MSNPKRETSPEPVKIGAQDFTTHENHLLMAGLLVDDPSLHEQDLTVGEWQSKIDAYGKSVRI